MAKLQESCERDEEEEEEEEEEESHFRFGAIFKLAENFKYGIIYSLFFVFP
jgi:hypothetical protein